MAPHCPIGIKGTATACLFVRFLHLHVCLFIVCLYRCALANVWMSEDKCGSQLSPSTKTIQEIGRQAWSQAPLPLEPSRWPRSALSFEPSSN